LEQVKLVGQPEANVRHPETHLFPCDPIFRYIPFLCDRIIVFLLNDRDATVRFQVGGQQFQIGLPVGNVVKDIMEVGDVDLIWWEARIVRLAQDGLDIGGAFKLAQNIKSGVKALDPMTGEVKWTFEVAARDHTVQVGGVLSTATGVVFQGNLETFYGLRGGGSLLWSVNLGGRINAPPMSYAINEQQFVVLAAGGTLHAFALPMAGGLNQLKQGSESAVH